jgi:hypothetical protein
MVFCFSSQNSLSPYRSLLRRSPPSRVIDAARAGLLLRRRHSTMRARRPPPPPPPQLYRTRRPPPPPPLPHRGKIEVTYVGIFHHVCCSIEAMYVGNVDRSSHSE